MIKTSGAEFFSKTGEYKNILSKKYIIFANNNRHIDGTNNMFSMNSLRLTSSSFCLGAIIFFIKVANIIFPHPNTPQMEGSV